MSSPQAMNDEIVNTQGEGVTFNFGAANFISNAGGPIPLRENTQQGIFDRAIQGGRIDTGNFDLYTSEQIITKSCQQLGITTANRSIYNQSKELLNNMNDNDRLLIANELDDDEATNTIS